MAVRTPGHCACSTQQEHIQHVLRATCDSIELDGGCKETQNTLALVSAACGHIFHPQCSDEPLNLNWMSDDKGLVQRTEHYCDICGDEFPTVEVSVELRAALRSLLDEAAPDLDGKYDLDSIFDHESLQQFDGDALAFIRDRFETIIERDTPVALEVDEEEVLGPDHYATAQEFVEAQFTRVQQHELNVAIGKFTKGDWIDVESVFSGVTLAGVDPEVVEQLKAKFLVENPLDRKPTSVDLLTPSFVAVPTSAAADTEQSPMGFASSKLDPAVMRELVDVVDEYTTDGVLNIEGAFGDARLDEIDGTLKFQIKSKFEAVQPAAAELLEEEEDALENPLENPEFLSAFQLVFDENLNPDRTYDLDAVCNDSRLKDGLIKAGVPEPATGAILVKFRQEQEEKVEWEATCSGLELAGSILSAGELATFKGILEENTTVGELDIEDAFQALGFTTFDPALLERIKARMLQDKEVETVADEVLDEMEDPAAQTPHEFAQSLLSAVQLGIFDLAVASHTHEGSLNVTDLFEDQTLLDSGIDESVFAQIQEAYSAVYSSAAMEVDDELQEDPEHVVVAKRVFGDGGYATLLTVLEDYKVEAPGTGYHLRQAFEDGRISQIYDEDQIGEVKTAFAKAPGFAASVEELEDEAPAGPPVTKGATPHGGRVNRCTPRVIATTVAVASVATGVLLQIPGVSEAVWGLVENFQALSVSEA